MNKAFLDIYGYTREEIEELGTEHLYWNSEDRHAYIGKLMTEKRLENYQLVQKSKSGKRIDVLVNIQLVEAAGERVIEGTLIDTTQQEELNRKLIENEKKYRDLFENSLEIIQSFDSAGKLIFCNQVWFDTMEYTMDDLNNLVLFDFIAPEYHEHCTDLFHRVVSGETIQNTQVAFISKSGRRIELNGNVVPIMKDGVMVSTHGFFRDVTIENQQKRQLSSQQIFFENILHNVPAEIKVYDHNFRYLYLNPQAFRGIESRQMVVGKSDEVLAEQGLWSEIVARTRMEKLKQASLTRQKISYKENNHTEDGKIRTILWNVFPVYDQNENPEMLICFGTDVTELEENRRMLSENNTELTKVNHELDRFVYSVSHDLRSPIASVLGLINLMDKTALPQDTQSYMDMISSVMIRMDQVIFDILEYSRNSRLELVAELVDVKELIQTAFETYQHFSPKKAKLLVHDSESVPLYSDQRRIRSVVNNLISNALKYSRKNEGEVLVEVSIEINPKELILKIKDNGEGIKPQYQDKIFDMFYRASISATGSGLGLYICKEIIQKLEGAITVVSDLGLGTTFTTIIPNKTQNK
jgi:PAS domain S-box-containing protein